MLERADDLRKAWRGASQIAGNAEVASEVVSKVVRKMIHDGALRRSPQRAKTEKAATVQISEAALATIRRHLTEIRRAAKGAEALGRIEKALDAVEMLLPA